uniref:Uncharacterized protein n=1 Tax=Caenorhabditis tropicalis TaxID=1561998 RepID=A0A1I7TTS5_9PELO
MQNSSSFKEIKTATEALMATMPKFNGENDDLSFIHFVENSNSNQMSLSDTERCEDQMETRSLKNPKNFIYHS